MDSIDEDEQAAARARARAASRRTRGAWRSKKRYAMKAIDEDEAQQLRDLVMTSLANIGILAAFMCALANAIYASPPEPPRCFGEVAITWIIVLEWLSMAAFFVAMITTVVLAADLDGVSNDKLRQHMDSRPVVYMHVLPQLATVIGIKILALGYGIDIGERRGCVYSYIFIPGSLLFVMFVICFAGFARAYRFWAHWHSTRPVGGASGPRVLLGSEDPATFRAMPPLLAPHGAYWIPASYFLMDGSKGCCRPRHEP